MASARILLSSYDRILLFFSGGKDSAALFAALIELGVPPSKIELHHHLVDGKEGSKLMEWPITPGYCQAFADSFGSPISWSWREGGFQREMLRNDDPTAPVHWIDQEGKAFVTKPNLYAPNGTRLKFPQVTANLSQRWCSSALKIDVASRWITNDPSFIGIRTLVLTGERAEESVSRATYQVFEPHRDDLRDGRKKRHIDHLRLIHNWKEERVWRILKRNGIRPHPAYEMGWSRCSCIRCIFGNEHQIASARLVDPSGHAKIQMYEDMFGVTIHRSKSLRERLVTGTPYGAITPEMIALANSHIYHPAIIVKPAEWKLPAGAFGNSLGPT